MWILVFMALSTEAWAAVTVGDADAKFEVGLTQFTVPTQAQVLSRAFINQPDAVMSKELTAVTVPTRRIVTSKIFLVADAMLTTTLIPFPDTIPPPPPLELPGNPILGDINGDGEIDSKDAILILRFSVNLQTPTAQQKTAADVSRDGMIDSKDAILILRRAVGLISAFPKPMPAYSIGRLVPVRPFVRQWADGKVDLLLALDHSDEVAGGDLFLTYEPRADRAVDVQLKGLSSNDLLVTNTNVPGQVGVSFAGQGTSKASEQVVLRVRLSGVEVEENLSVSLEGYLYNSQGMSVGEIRTSQIIHLSLPVEYALWQNYPNPFNPTTTIHYQLPEAGHAVLNIYNLNGQLVRMLVDEQTSAGYYAADWDGRDAQDRELGSGIYFYRLSLDGGRFTASRRMVLLK